MPVAQARGGIYVCVVMDATLRRYIRGRSFSFMEGWGKFKIVVNAVCELWVGLQTCAISVRRTYTESSVLWALHGPSKPTRCGRGLQDFSTFGTKRRSKSRYSHLVICWDPVKRFHGDVGAAGQGAVQDPERRVLIDKNQHPKK